MKEPQTLYIVADKPANTKMSKPKKCKTNLNASYNRRLKSHATKNIKFTWYSADKN